MKVAQAPSPEDLLERLSRYRERLAAEGRSRAVRQLDELVARSGGREPGAGGPGN